ncbi:preprotein translocase subunit SecE [Coralloluteibacterium stylophorae]|uniref:Protein translocase subunit SecE n=1 Tax=Coralloluteibacterium stylophorae TaxID=1776034 RepID=A0AAP2C966_9GAMM|nr:preprotein translocase subunit SecE [Coralloluteibacterium stylophorae]MBS7456596.1 preprotein translocase subunit SecE [Coralloluteibacterium stylophorae]
MNSKAEQSAGATTGADIAKYAVSALLIIAAIVIGTFDPFGLAAPLPTVIGLVGAIAGVALLLPTTLGRRASGYLGEARFELRKVVWPTRQETTRMTLVVAVVVVILTILVGIIDFLISGGMRLLLGN